MDKLIQNVTNIMGEKGKTWIASLPNTVKIVADYWQLSNIVPVNNMSFHYVAKAIRNHNQPVVLKIGFDSKVAAAEKHALIYFNGNASVRLINYDKKYNALLLEQAIPGTPLKSLYPTNVKFVIDCYIDTMQKLHNQPSTNKQGFRHIGDWLKRLEGFKSDLLPQNLLEKAIYLKTILLSSTKKEVLLHGDLHLDNVLKNRESWLTIDPKGIIGEPEFEITAFDFIHDSEFTDDITIKKLLLNRINLISTTSKLNRERIKNWLLVRLVLSAVWTIEDNGDPSLAIKLAPILNEI